MHETFSDRLGALIAQFHPEGTNNAAAAMGIPQPTLHKILTGKSQNPHAGTLRRLSEYFDVSIDWLLTGNGPLPTALLRDRPFERSEAVLLRAGVPAKESAAVLTAGYWRYAFTRALRIKEPVKGMSADSFRSHSLRARNAEDLFDQFMALELELFIDQFGVDAAKRHFADPAVKAELHRISCSTPAESRDGDALKSPPMRAVKRSKSR